LVQAANKPQSLDQLQVDLLHPELDQVEPTPAQEQQEPQRASDSVVQAANEPFDRMQVDQVEPAPVHVRSEFDHVGPTASQEQQEPQRASDSLVQVGHGTQSLDQLQVGLIHPELDHVDPTLAPEQQESQRAAEESVQAANEPQSRHQLQVDRVHPQLDHVDPTLAQDQQESQRAAEESVQAANSDRVEPASVEQRPDSDRVDPTAAQGQQDLKRALDELMRAVSEASTLNQRKAGEARGTAPPAGTEVTALTALPALPGQQGTVSGVQPAVHSDADWVPQARLADTGGSGGGSDNDRLGADAAERPPINGRLHAMIQAARYHGVELDVNEFRQASEAAPSAAALSLWAQNAGMWSKAVRIRWRHLLRFHDTGPVVLLFTDGGAGLLTGANAEQKVVLLTDPHAPAGAAPVAVDELRLSQVWAGEAVLVRASRGYVAADAPFNLRWLIDLVLQERRSLRDIALASFTISFLTIFPPLLVMATVNRVLQFHSISTLILISLMMVIVVAHETLVRYARRFIMAVVGALLDS